MRTCRACSVIAALAVLVFDLLAAAPANARWPSGATQSLAVTPAGRGTGMIDACADGAGGVYFAWGLSYPPYGTFLEHLDAFGNDVFANGTWLPDTAIGNPWHLVADDAGALNVLTETYPGGGVNGLSLTRISPLGIRAWTAPLWTGVLSGSWDWTRIAEDPAGGGTLVAWSSGASAPYTIRAQRVSRDGAIAWGDSGALVVSSPVGLDLKAIEPDGAGGCWMAFVCDSSPPQVRVQHVGPNGALTLPPSGALVSPGFSLWQVASDAAGGLYVSFSTNNPNAPDRIQRVRSDGSLALGPYGVMPAGPPGAMMMVPSLGAAADGHVFVAWQASEYGYWGARVQLMDSTGAWLWPGSGMLAGKTFASGLGTRIYRNADGGATITVQPALQVPGAVSGAQRFALDGTMLWPDPPPTLIVLQSYDQSNYNTDYWFSAPTGDGGVVYFTTLADSGSGNNQYAYSVRAQHLDGNGRRGDTAPRILDVHDVPNDLGGALEARWKASCLEGDATMATTGYDVLREDPDGAGGTAFTVVGHRAATGDSEYACTVATLADSTSPVSRPAILRVRAADGSGRTWTSPADSAASFANTPPLAVGPADARALALARPAPSPASTRTLVRFTLPAPAAVQLDLFDLGGRKVRSLARGDWPAGEQAVRLGIADDSGGRLTAGLYFIRLVVGDAARVQRLVVLP